MRPKGYTSVARTCDVSKRVNRGTIRCRRASTDVERRSPYTVLLGYAWFCMSAAEIFSGTFEVTLPTDAVRVTFAYLDRDQVGSQRSVEPYQLVTQARRWYLVACDPDRNDWRTFRVDRISDARSLRNSFTPRVLPSDDIGEYVRARIERSRYTTLSRYA